MPPEAVADLREALEAAGITFTSETYPDTVHGFTMADTAAYSRAGLAAHWARLPLFLDRALATT
ncbi:dienelactone hydrolase family protein [Streptomyces sp. NPDC058734]|uniref:dienelactone hydrolase family protein n=1 Tax=Streptomyces sp. NPDC058734 TaxID=3346615 RepID=UPI0036741E22